MNKNRFPIYIPSYDRWQEGRHPTMDSLDRMGLHYNIVVREAEYDKYVTVFGKDKVLKCPEEYIKNYQTLDSPRLTKSIGPGAQRNYAWEHSISQGHEWHWVMDDNIRGFYRFHNNLKIRINSGLFFRIMENFVLQYENIGMAGPNYTILLPRKTKHPPLIFNTRIYSCNLIRNNLPFRWRGRYNEDTILSLDILSAGQVTVQFNTLLQDKAPTQTIKGGNNTTFYSKEGTYPKSQMLKEAYPHLTEVVQKFHRWHHQVNYAPFKRNKLIKKKHIPPDLLTKYDFKLYRKEIREK